MKDLDFIFNYNIPFLSYRKDTYRTKLKTIFIVRIRIHWTFELAKSLHSILYGQNIKKKDENV